MEKRTFFGSRAFKAFACLALVVSSLSSCSGLEELRGKVDELEMRLDSLELSLNNQLDALDAFCSGKTTITELKENNDGSHTIELSDGTKFTVYPKSTEHGNLLTYVEVEGVKYWATYNGAGEAVALLDIEGNMIPVQTDVVMPTVEERDGEYVLIIGEEEYTTGYTVEEIVTVFSAYELNKDDSGNVYSVTFTFGEDMKFTISVDGYKGFSFHAANDVNENVIKDYYVPLASTVRLRVKTEDVVDYVMQIPDGWRVKEVTDQYTKETYLDVTAPTKEAIEAGAAVANGNLKVVAVVEGGKSMVARLELSTNPFKKFLATTSNAIIEKYNGVDKFLYGLSAYNEYDEDAIIAGAQDMLNKNEAGVSEIDVNMSLSSLLGQELVVGDYYVLWAIPALYDEETGFAPGALLKVEFGATVATISVADEDILFNDVKMSMKLAGFDAYYGGTDMKTDEVFDEILYQVNNGIEDPCTKPMTYEGSVFEFPTKAANQGIDILSNCSYVTWMIPVKYASEGETVEYTKDDIIYKEYTLPSVTAGGTLPINVGEATLTCTTVSVPLTSENALRLYYAYVEEDIANSMFKNDADAIEMLLANKTIQGIRKVVVDGSETVALTEGCKPKINYVLLAISVDNKGKYGKLQRTLFTTPELKYNENLTVTLSCLSATANAATLEVKLDPSCDCEYIYWIGPETDEFWSTMGKSRMNAQKYMALYPNDSNIRSSMRSYSLDASTGKITCTDLKGKTKYAAIILAKDKKDAAGLYSYSGFTWFETLAVDLGDVVYEDNTKYAEAKSQVKVEYIESSFGFDPTGEMARYYFNFTSSLRDMTAYVLAGSRTMFQDNKISSVEEKIIYISNAANAKRASGVSPEGYEYEGYLLNKLYAFHIYGCPPYGSLVYLPSGYNITADKLYLNAKADIADFQTMDAGRYKDEAEYKYYYDNFYKPGLQYSEPIYYINDGVTPVRIEQHYGNGFKDNAVHDLVYVVLKDAQGNYYAPFVFEVPNKWGASPGVMPQE